jgi:large subunit ribosomal protein L3
MKRWHFGGQRASHGNSKAHRKPGAIGRHYSTAKGVPKNHPMAGHLGSDRVTVRGLELVDVDEKANLLLVKGAVPGANGSYLIVRRSVKDRAGSPPGGTLY